MADTKAANLRLESRAYSLLHFLSAIEGRSKAEIVEEALKDYAELHRDRFERYAQEVAGQVGLSVRAIRGGARRSRQEILSSKGRRRLTKA